MTAAPRFWSTADAPPGRALAYWAEVVCDVIAEMEIDSGRPDGFHADLSQFDLGPVTISVIRSREQAVSRGRRAIARSPSPRFDLVYVRQGRMSLEHYGKSIDLQGGECTLLDNSEPFSFACEPRSHRDENFVVHFPQAWLKSWIASPYDGVGRRINAATPWGAALVSSLKAITHEDLEEMAAPGHLLATQIAGSLALALGPEPARHTEHGRRLILRLRGVLQERAHETDLDAAAVAAAAGISIRYLHAAFASAETTYGAELMEIRLTRGAQMLSDKRFRDLSVGEIAWRCGFVAPSHFARRFREKYQTSPAAYRLRVGLAPSQ